MDHIEIIGYILGLHRASGFSTCRQGNAWLTQSSAGAEKKTLDARCFNPSP